MYFRTTTTALAIGISALVFTPAAEAGGRYHGHYRHHGHIGHGAFIGGFAAGALLGALAQPYYGGGYYGGGYHDGGYYGGGYAPRYYHAPRPYYYQPAPRYYYEEGPGYYGCDSDGAVSRPANAMC